MIEKRLARAVRFAVYLACDVSVAVACGLAETVQRVAAAVLENVVPDDGRPAAAPQGLDSAAAMGMPLVVAQALGLAPPGMGAPEQPPQPAPVPAAPPGPAPLWVPMLAGELTRDDIARFNNQDYEVVNVRHESDEPCHGEPIPVVILHMRDLRSGEEGLLSAPPKMPILGQPRIPDDPSELGGPDGARA